MAKPTTAPATSTTTNTIARPAHRPYGSGASTPPRYGTSDAPNCQPSQMASTQVTSEQISCRKPRTMPTTAESRKTARMM
jgi:hypothetical protein